MRHTPEKLDKIIEAVRKHNSPTLIEALLTMSLPYLDAEAANKRILELEIDNLRLQAKLDAIEIERDYFRLALEENQQ